MQYGDININCGILLIFFRIHRQEYGQTITVALIFENDENPDKSRYPNELKRNEPGEEFACPRLDGELILACVATVFVDCFRINYRGGAWRSFVNIIKPEKIPVVVL